MALSQCMRSAAAEQRQLLRSLPGMRQLLFMSNFPAFMKNPANRIVTSNQATPGVEGFIFDGVDGSQMAFWTCTLSAPSAAHVHEYDEYMVVVDGCYTLIIDGQKIPLYRGDEY
jgi:mannose-6-phosphate isomerase-like protein (cupin superfamily)